MMHICDFDGSQRIGKPGDWDEALDGACLDLFVAHAVDTMSGLPVLYSVFKPSVQEMEALLAGGVIRIGIVGQTSHPVMNIGVLGPETTESAHVIPRGDLGQELISP